MSDGYQRNWETRRGGKSVSDRTRDSYYGLPVIHAPQWKWLIIFYFFLGGISSASYVIACAAELWGGSAGDRIKRAGRYIALATLIPCPWLLIADLGRPERFHHMLRVLKLRSPMSVGTWGLSLYGVFCTLSVILQAAQDGLLDRLPRLRQLANPLPCTLINAIGGVFGFFVGGYTGVLLGITAVPIWAKNALLLGPMFLSSAMSTGAAAVALALGLLRDGEQSIKRLERLEVVARLAELGMILAARSHAGPAISRPTREGRLGQVFRWGVLGAGVAAPLALQLGGAMAGKRAARPRTILTSLLTLAGGLCLRYVMVMAGRASANDPQATFEFARHRRD